MKRLCIAFFVVAGVPLIPAVAKAQHYDVRHGGPLFGHYEGHTPLHLRDRLPVYEGAHYGRPDWHYVVPQHDRYAGSYYTSGTSHYYTAAPITSLPPTASTAMPLPATAIATQRPIEVAFGGFSRYEDLAGRLVAEANAMCLDMNYNYRHNRNFNDVYAEAYGVLQAAKYVHAADHSGNRAAIVQQVVEIDKLFHHVREEVSGWRRENVKLVGNTELLPKLQGVEAIIHHLAFDIGVKPHEQVTEDAPPPVVAEEIAPPPAIKK